MEFCFVLLFEKKDKKRTQKDEKLFFQKVGRKYRLMQIHIEQKNDHAQIGFS